MKLHLFLKHKIQNDALHCSKNQITMYAKMSNQQVCLKFNYYMKVAIKRIKVPCMTMFS